MREHSQLSALWFGDVRGPFDLCYRSDEAVSSPGEGLNIPWALSIIREYAAEFLYNRI